jgi:16S rRNA (cytidine1402-2'-O)-methyltransferase
MALGCLFVVSTPIGNLGDITRRAVEVLSKVACVAAEDTRRTRALLSHLGIGDKPLRSLNAHSSRAAIAQLVERLLEGDDVAFVTDAGTPAVSDPGGGLVAAAAARDVPVRIIPGASAVTAAVALSGLVEGPFTFLGFLPRRGPERQASLTRLRYSVEPIVLFESPMRMQKTLADFAEQFPDRPLFVGRELTKLYEEGLRGSVAELAARTDAWRGEIVMVLGAANADEREAAQGAEQRALCDAALRAAIACGVSPSRITRALADASGLPKKELYDRALELAGSRDEDEPEGGAETAAD